MALRNRKHAQLPRMADRAWELSDTKLNPLCDLKYVPVIFRQSMFIIDKKNMSGNLSENLLLILDESSEFI